MRAIPAAMAALFTLLIPAQLLSGPDPLLKITIKGGSLTKPIEIADTELLARFFYGSGPGNYNSRGENAWTGPSFIVDWPRGVANEPWKGLAVYDVEFLTSRTTDMNTYRVTYMYDAATQEGFVFLPGETDPRYRENTWLLKRGIEGSWFHAWSSWDATVKPLLANAR